MSMYISNTISSIEAALHDVFGSARVSPWALLDAPIYTNVGDSAIWLGTLAILRQQLGRGPDFVTRCAEFPGELNNTLPEGPALLTGGGNFGDLWPGYWQNRVKILQTFRNRKIVQLPQSIHFSADGKEALEATKRAVGGHPDFTLMVRDLPSHELACKHFECHISLVPDMAFGLKELRREESPAMPIFALMRADRERLDYGGTAQALQDRVLVGDWEREAVQHGLIERILLKAQRKQPALRPYMMGRIGAAYQRYCEKNLARGVLALGQGDVVITDRLHGHIICTLMNKPHVVLDNSYGKITSYIKAWPGNDLVRVADSIPQALAVAEDLLAVVELR